MWNFQEVFLIILTLFANLKLMSVLFIHETFLVYKLETFTNCKEVKHIMIMIIAIIYFFLSYVIIDLSFRKSPHPPEKIYSAFILSPLLKTQKVHVLFLPTMKIFQALPAERQGELENTMLSLVGMVTFFPILV